MTQSTQIARLEKKLEARDKTIAVLKERVDRVQQERSSGITMLEEAIIADKLVTAKTAQLEKALLELGQAQAHLLQAHKLEAIGQLAAGIAHEINTPTQFVSDNVRFLERMLPRVIQALRSAQSLVDGECDVDTLANALRSARVELCAEEVPRCLEQSAEGLRRISSIVQAMKEFSHPSGGEMQQVNLNDIVTTTITVARNEWRYVADLEMHLDPDAPQVECTRDELGQVILNLVVNAAHAIEEASLDTGMRGKITVATRRDGPEVELSVSDSGCGIPEAIRHRIFEPFFTTKPVGRGTGQGLAIAYAVVAEKHKGSIRCESEVGVGTTFRVRLPVSQSTE